MCEFYAAFAFARLQAHSRSNAAHGWQSEEEFYQAYHEPSFVRFRQWISRLRTRIPKTPLPDEEMCAPAPETL